MVEIWYVCAEVVWQAYVYILLKANRYDDGFAAAVKPSAAHVISTRWGLLVVRNTPRIARRRMELTHLRQASRHTTTLVGARTLTDESAMC